MIPSKYIGFLLIFAVFTGSIIDDAITTSDGTLDNTTPFQKIADGVGGFTGNTLDNDDWFGISVASIGDLNGDGVTDLAVGAPRDGSANGDNNNGDDRGAVYILFMKSDGTVSSFQKIADGVGGFTGNTLDNFDEFGISVASIGDLNGDGVTDLAVGAFLDDSANGNNNAGTDRGAVYILFLKALSSSNSSGDVSAPSFNFDKYTIANKFPDKVLQTIQSDPFTPIQPVNDDTIDLPITINDNGYAISQYTNTIVTNTIETGDPTNLKLVLFDDTGIEHVAIYTNIRDNQREISDSDTYIIYDEYKELQVSDPHGFFSFVNVAVSKNSTKYVLDYNITFAKPMEKSGIILRTWDERRNSADVRILDAWEIVGEEIKPENELQYIIEPEIQNEQSIMEQNEVSLILDKWSGYHSESVSDSEMLKELGMQGSDIPHWVKKIFGKGIHYKKLEIKDLVVALEYLQKIGVVK